MSSLDTVTSALPLKPLFDMKNQPIRAFQEEMARCHKEMEGEMERASYATGIVLAICGIHGLVVVFYHGSMRRST